MTKVLILSDSHGLTNEISKIRKRHQIEHVIHCGDSELEMNHPVLEGTIIVKGNCDFDAKLPNVQELNIGEIKYFVTHGHLYNVGTNLQDLYDDANRSGAQVVCYGHTHVAGAKKIDDILFVNPGSIRMPRQRDEKTYAIMDWDHIDQIHIDFYTHSGQKVDELSYLTSLKAT